MNNNIATNSTNNEENNTCISIWILLRGWIMATILVLICLITGVALLARSLDDFPYPYPGYTGNNNNNRGYNTNNEYEIDVALDSSSSSSAYPDNKDYGGMLNGVPPTSSPSWIQSYTHEGLYNNGTYANIFTTAPIATSLTSIDDEDNHEIKYIAVIGWYACMIGLVFCIIPTLMTIYQRRIRQAENNTREEMQSNMRMIQIRMNDIEAQHHQQQQRRFESGGLIQQEDDNVTMFLSATENHDCTWDSLEGLFATATTPTTPTTTTTTPTVVAPRNSVNNDAAFIGNNGTHGLVGRRRHMMNDILLGVTAIDFIRGHVEKEILNRRDCRRRLLAALKLYSLRVNACHLISVKVADDDDDDDDDDGGGISLLTTPRRDDIEVGDINSGTAPMKGNTSDDSKNGESNIADDIADGCDNVNYEVAVNKMAISETDEIVVSGLDAKINTNINDNTRSNFGAAETEEDGVSNSQHPDEEKTQCSQSADVVSKSLQVMSVFSTTSRKDSPHVVVNDHDVNVTDVEDDDDNKYSALLIPSTTLSSSENSLTRTVIPTCAICLVQYKPGNYVTWSSNDECCHAFHRDCILIWLLKKDASNDRSRRNNGVSNDGDDGGCGGNLCPCCRGEFVSNILLKEIVDAETTASSAPTTAI